MIIIVNKETKEIINNMGTNSAFPKGDIEVNFDSETEEVVRLHDKSELAQKILKEKKKFKFNEDCSDIVITETEEETLEKNKVKQKQGILKELAQLDKEIPRIIEDIIEHTNYTPHESKQSIIDKKKQLRQQLKNLEG